MVGGACGFHPCPGVRAFSPDISSEQIRGQRASFSLSAAHARSELATLSHQVSAPHGSNGISHINRASGAFATSKSFSAPPSIPAGAAGVQTS